MVMPVRKLLLIMMALVGLVLTGCGNDDSAEDNTATGSELPTGGKFDTPAGKEPPEVFCAKRRAEALEGANKHFVPGFIRWPVADVEGVNTVGQDDRGQEYTEYFAIVHLPPAEEGGERPAPVALGQNLEEGGTTPLGVELTDDQDFYMEDNGDEVMGQCIFTSWHQDTPGPLPICGEDESGCPEFWGHALTARNFRMKVSFNSNSAAALLVQDCIDTFDREEIQPDREDPEDPLHDDFFRGCMLAHYTYQTEWRSSDTAVCAAALRIVECGCGIIGGGDPGVSLVPPQPVFDEEGNSSITLRGFKLGGWDDWTKLPDGCRQVDTGEEMHALVACDLTATDIRKKPEDPKEVCRQKYGNNVVVHVPVPEAAIECPEPGSQEGVNGSMCTATPWRVGETPEDEPAEPDDSSGAGMDPAADSTDPGNEDSTDPDGGGGDETADSTDPADGGSGDDSSDGTDPADGGGDTTGGDTGSDESGA